MVLIKSLFLAALVATTSLAKGLSKPPLIYENLEVFNLISSNFNKFTIRQAYPS